MFSKLGVTQNEKKNNDEALNSDSARQLVPKMRVDETR